MKRRRLLVICYFFPPLAGGGVHRVLSFTRHLPEHGWDCTVVCAGPRDYWVTDPTLAERIRPDTEVVRVAGGSALTAWLRLRPADRGRRPSPLFGMLRRATDWWLLPDSYVGWTRHARRVAAEIVGRGDIDVVLSSSPPDSVHLVALDIWKRFHRPWVADFRDPWLGLTFRRPPTSWHRAKHEHWQSEVLGHADLVLAASRTHADQLRARLGPERAERVVHLPNGFEPASGEGATTPEGAAEADGPGQFVLGFTGTMSQMPDVELFLDALHDLLARHPEARRRLRVRLLGPFETGYADRAEALGLTGIVEFKGPRPHAESRALQRRADVLLLWQTRDFPTMVPGKVYEYFEAGRPILAVLDPATESAELMRAAGHGVVPIGRRDELVTALERHYLAWKQGAPIVAGPPAWLERHRRDRLAATLAQQLDRLVERAA